MEIILRIIYLVLGEEPMILMAVLALQRKSLSADFRKTKIQFCLSLHHNGDSSHLFVNVNFIILKPTIKMNTFLLNFISEAYLKKFNYVDSEEVSFRGNVYDFTANYNAINKSEALNIHENLMVNNNTK